jgi:hypothetical protein
MVAGMTPALARRVVVMVLENHTTLPKQPHPPV